MSAESRREAHRRAQGADALQGRFSRPCDAPRFVVSFTGFRQTPDGKSDTPEPRNKRRACALRHRFTLRGYV